MFQSSFRENTDLKTPTEQDKGDFCTHPVRYLNIFFFCTRFKYEWEDIRLDDHSYIYISLSLTNEGESEGSRATKSPFLCGTSVTTQSQQRLLVERKVVVIAITEGWKGKRGEWMVSVDGRWRGGLLHKTETESQQAIS